MKYTLGDDFHNLKKKLFMIIKLPIILMYFVHTSQISVLEPHIFSC